MQRGLEADYFDNINLSGSPVYSRIDQQVNFYWTGSPGVTGIGADNFSIRWSGYIIPSEDGLYDFSVASDDGFRLYINDTIFMEDWTDHATQYSNRRAYLSSGIKYHIVLEYYENGGIAEIRMGYLDLAAVIQAAALLAADVDVMIVCEGFGSENEGEGWDRTFELPYLQAEVIDAVADVNDNTIVVLFAGGAVETSPWLDKVKGFIHAFYPGQYGGYALAEILFGDVNPGGKLPFSFDEEWADNPAYNDYYAAGSYDAMPYSEGIFVGYRYYDTASTVVPLYPFGYGLSYTTFGYANLTLVPDDELDFTTLNVSFDITNTGDRAGSEIAQLYIHDLESELIRPEKELKAFKKVWLEPAETKVINFSIPLRAFKYYKESLGEWDFDPGDFEILIGASSQDIRLRDTLSLEDEMVMPEALKLYPHDNGIFIESEPYYSIRFSRDMECIGSEFYVRNYSGQSKVDSFSVSDLQGCGTSVITFHSDQSLDFLTEYFIDIPNGYFVDDLGKNFKGFTSKDDWNFKTNAETPVSIENENSPSSFYLFPNPAKDKLTIFFTKAMAPVRLELTDLNGTILYNTTTDKDQVFYHLDLSGIPPGTYMLNMLNDEVSYSEKVVVL